MNNSPGNPDTQLFSGDALHVGNTPADSDSDISAGALCLLRNCVGAQSGDRLLVVTEPSGAGYYDEAAPQLTAAAARSLGLRVYETEAPIALKTATDIAAFVNVLRGFDHVVFFARVGDQLRFSDLYGVPPATMCYTLGREMLDSAFGTACYQGLCTVKNAVNSAFESAEHIRITCPLGSDYTGRPPRSIAQSQDVSLKRFPMLVPKPVPAVGFSGRVALSRFLVGTGSRFYEPYYLPLETTVFAHVENNLILGFEGNETQCARVRAHYLQVSEQFDIDPWFVHSWHAGIHPACTFPADATKDLLRWSGSAFGNPRILHFHTCGDYAPGEISWNIIDPTIYLDDVAVWQNGQLFPERLPGGSQMLDPHPRLAELYRIPDREIGIVDIA